MNRLLTAVLAAALLAVPSAASAGTPAAGVTQEIRSGFFADMNFGGLFTAGATNKSVSNAQVFFQLGVGYDILKTVKPTDTFGLALGLNLGFGTSAAACYANVDANDNCVVDNTKKPLVSAPDNFSIYMFGAEVIFKVQLADRIYLRPRIVAGYALLDPEPIQGTSGGVYAGAAVGVEYATHMDHFSIGVDVEFKMIIGPNIPAVAFYPMVKYTF